MNKTIKHILKGILFVVIAIVVIFLCIRTYYKFFNSNDTDLTTEETDILLLSQTYPTTFYFIGDTIPLDKSITTKNITVDEVSNITTSKKEWAMLVINDLNDDLPIREEQWKNKAIFPEKRISMTRISLWDLFTRKLPSSIL